MPDHPYRVTVLIHSLNPGGAQQRVITVANGLAQRGAKVRFVATKRLGDADKMIDPAIPVAVLTERKRSRWESRFRFGLTELQRDMADHPTDILLAGSTSVHGIAFQAVRAMPASARPKLVLRASRHPDRPVGHRKRWSRTVEPLRRMTFRRINRAADLIIAVAEDVAEGIRAHLPARVPSVVLDNPVLSDSFEAALAERPDHPWTAPDRDVPLLLSVSRLSQQKGLNTLLDAFAMVVKRRPARLIVIGEGKLRAELEAQRAALGLDDLVDFPGHQPISAPWLANADLMVSSSRYEGASAVLVETLAAGLPMVITDCPGNNREIIDRTGAGSLVPVDDAAALAAAIEQALDRQWDRESIRGHAERYRVGPAVDAYHRALLDLLDR